MSSHHQLLQTLIAAGCIIEAQGLGDLTRGHISLRVPGEPDRFFMKPHSVGFDEMSPENIVTCSLDGEKIIGLRVQWSDYLPVYRTPAGTGVGAGFVIWQ